MPDTQKEEYGQLAHDDFNIEIKCQDYLKSINNLDETNVIKKNINCLLDLYHEQNPLLIDNYFTNPLHLHDLTTGQNEIVKSIKDFDVQWTRAFTQKKLIINDIIADDTRVVVNWTWIGIHDKGMWNNIPITHLIVTNPGMSIYTFLEHKIKSITQLWDGLSLLKQIDVISTY